MFRKIPFLVWPLNLETVERKRKEQHSIQYLKNERAFERKLNPLFITFEMVSFDKMEKKKKKTEDTSFKFECSDSY